MNFFSDFDLDFSLLNTIKLQTILDCRSLPARRENGNIIAYYDEDKGNIASLQSFFIHEHIEPIAVKSNDFDIIIANIKRHFNLNGICKDIKEQLKNATYSDDSAILRLIDFIFDECIYYKASDLHIEPFEDTGCIVRARIDGMLSYLFELEFDIYNALLSRIKLLSGLDITERKKPQDGRFSKVFNSHSYDFRVSTLPLIYGESLVIRILDKSKSMLEIENLGLYNNSIKILKQALSKPHGIFLVTGPTGCGKSTTLHAALNHIKDMNKKIISIENPVEYRLNLVQQVSAESDTDFNLALRAILRQDPDIIMIGEIRDPNTLKISLQAALSGHLVLSTLHTNDAIGAITRMVDLGAQNYLIASSLIGVMAQRLVRKLCPHCKRKIQLSENDLNDLKDILPQNYQFYAPVGCVYCANTGFSGREIIAEIFLTDDISSSAIANGSNKQELSKSIKLNTSLFKDGISKAASGITSLDEIFRVIKN